MIAATGDDAWIRVTDAATRKAVATKLLKKGETYTAPAGDYLLRTGRAGALSVSVDGRALPPLGGPAQAVTVRLDRASLLARAGAGPAS